MADYYVYVHRRNDNKEFFYVGKGKNKRHLSTKNRNKHWTHIVESVGYSSYIVISGIDEELAFLCEIELISKLRSLNCNLVNYTDGGDGWSGGKHSEQTKHKLSQLHKNNKYWVGKRHKEESKIKMSNSKIDKPSWNANKHNVYNEHTIKKMSEAKKGLFKTYIWWNDGIKNTRSEKCPGDNWVRGVIRRSK